MQFKEWFSTRLKVTGYPDTWQAIDSDGRYKDFDVFINVSDEYQPKHHSALCNCGKQSFWFPLGECGESMGLSSIYGALQVLWHSWKEERVVLLHCHAGINRSQTVAAAFFFLVTGQHSEERTRMDGSKSPNMLIVNCGRHLPELELVEKWMNNCQIAFTNPEKYNGGMYDWTLRTSGIK